MTGQKAPTMPREEPRIPHPAKCARPPAHTRWGWDGRLEWYCPGCGRSVRKEEGR